MLKPLKIAVVYTGMPTSLVNLVESSIKQVLIDRPVTFLSFSAPDIIEDAIVNGSPSPPAVRRLSALYLHAVQQGAHIVYNACSSVGDIADAAKPLFEKMQIPFVRIDEGMARAAVGEHRTICVIATLSATLEPTKRLIRNMAEQEGRNVTLVDTLAEGAFGVSAQQLEELLVARALPLSDRVDCFLLAQGSMAGCEKAISLATGKPVYSSPRYGALDIQKIVEKLSEEANYDSL